MAVLLCGLAGCGTLGGFRRPVCPAAEFDSSSPESRAGLEFLEPYRRGKVPVVLIHGLFSQPRDWHDLVADLRCARGFSERYQLWTFGYPTTQGFLQSAAALRRELRAALDELEAGGRDPALHQIVLVGHSLGGLIAKLQVTHSDELVWTRVADRPLEEIVTTDQTRAFLAETCYFDPSPDVARVIFIATPHCGSLPTSAGVGECVSHLIVPTPQQAALHAQLMRDNPHVFNPQIERRFPTSIDMLAPDSPLLEAMRHMRLSTGVHVHTILGVSHPLSLDGPSDGVVSVNSAVHPGCQSVLAVAAPHAKVHRAVETSAEVARILDCHWRSHMPQKMDTTLPGNYNTAYEFREPNPAAGADSSARVKAPP
jgi:pimeloyl-ACP methyl ester carboxylesterase